MSTSTTSTRPPSSSRWTVAVPSSSSSFVTTATRGSPRSSARAVPVAAWTASLDWTPVRTRSALSSRATSARARATVIGSAPARSSDQTRTPRSAPIASARRIASSDSSSPTVRTTTSLSPAASRTRRASSVAYESHSLSAWSRKSGSTSRSSSVNSTSSPRAATCLTQTTIFIARRRRSDRDRLPLDHPPLPLERQRRLRIVRVDLARQPVAREDAVGDEARRLAVPDPVEGRDALRAQGVHADLVLELAVERLVRAALRHEDDRVGLELVLVRLVVVDVARDDAALLEPRRHVVRDDLHAELVQDPVLVRRLEREVHVWRDVPEVRHERDLLALVGELLRERDAHEVAVVVEDEHALAGRRLALGHDLLRRELPREARVRARDRVVRTAVQAVGCPVAAGGDDDDLGAVLLYARRVEPRVGDELDVLQLVDLDLAVVDHAGPLAQAGELRDPAHDPAHVVLRLDEVDAAHPALAEHHGALHPGRAGADDEHVVVGVLGRFELLRVPAAPVLLARGRVLRADERRAADLPARDADVGADALADVVQAPLVDLLRQGGVRDGRAAGRDDVERARFERLDHQVGVREAPHAEHRLLRDALHRLLPGEQPARLVEARRRRVLAPLGDARDVDVPDVHDVVTELDEREAVALELRAGLAHEHVRGHADADGAVVPDRLADLLDRLAPEAGAVLERAAVLVRAAVVVRRQELLRQVGVRAVDVDDVEAGFPRALRGLDVEALHLADVVSVHLLRVREVLEVARDLRGRARDAARLHAGRVGAAVPELGRREGAVLVEHVAHEREVLDVVVVPEPRGHAVRVVRLRVDRAVLGADGGVAALGLHRPEVRLAERLLGPEPVAVGDLVEAVLHRLRSDLDGLEEDVVPWVARHAGCLLLPRAGEAPFSNGPAAGARRVVLSRRR